MSETKIIRQIYGSVCEDDVSRVRSNSEINSLLQGVDIVRHTKYLRFSWLDHVEHMESEGTPKYLLNGELFGIHRRGRPRKRWFQEMKDNLRQMRIGKCKEKSKERNTWQLTVRETKVLEEYGEGGGEKKKLNWHKCGDFELIAYLLC
jgi:hypothetical protein